MDCIKLSSNNGYIQFEIRNIMGFPEHTSYLGGYEVQGELSIVADGYTAKALLYSSTGEWFILKAEIEGVLKDWEKEVVWCTSEDNLHLNITMDYLGHVKIEGHFQERFDSSSKLNFELLADQTYLNLALADFNKLYQKYGGMTGKKE